MKNLKYSFAAKMTTYFVFFLALIAGLGGIIGIVYMAEEGYYNAGSLTFYDTQACLRLMREKADFVYNSYLPLSLQKEPRLESQYALDQYRTKFSKGNTNFFFTVADSSGRVLLTNYEKQDYGAQEYYQYGAQDGEVYTITASVKLPISARDDFYEQNQWFSRLYSIRTILIAVAALSMLLALVMFISMMCAAGHRKGKEEIVLNSLDKIPLDLYGLGLFALAVFTVFLYQNNHPGGIWTVVALGVAAAIVISLVLAFCVSFAARLKAGNCFANTIVYRLFRLITRAIRALAKPIGYLFAQLPLIWKTALAFTGYLFINAILVLIFATSHGSAFWFLIGLLFNLAALGGICFLALQMRQLKLGGAKIAGGDFNYKIDTKNLLWDLKEHGEALNNIGLGMSKAVEDRLRSERFKTELITNVSHDIKTPLTSIVNYVDLLKKENIENETAAEYIEVLDRQSARLKKLTEDLVEASKALSGTIAVNPVRTNAVELLNQSMGEYAERFAASHLEVIVHAPQEEVLLLADGKLLWRVFDNLLNNICKYSQPNTRVYLDVGSTKGKVTITFKNISKYSLNVTADELMERFVRGDSSRSTEGSGLGLSIAKSLTELQKGSFALSIDGDLFKAIISFSSID